jgi:hypothetical protein
MIYTNIITVEIKENNHLDSSACMSFIILETEDYPALTVKTPFLWRPMKLTPHAWPVQLTSVNM